MKLPCINCICFAICKHTEIKTLNIGVFVTALGNKCSILRDYLYLLDLGISAIDFDPKLNLSERTHITKPLSQRLIQLCEYMGWSEFDLTREHIFAKGLIPEGEE